MEISQTLEGGPRISATEQNETAGKAIGLRVPSLYAIAALGVLGATFIISWRFGSDLISHLRSVLIATYLTIVIGFVLTRTIHIQAPTLAMCALAMWLLMAQLRTSPDFPIRA